MTQHLPHGSPQRNAILDLVVISRDIPERHDFLKAVHRFQTEGNLRDLMFHIDELAHAAYRKTPVHQATIDQIRATKLAFGHTEAQVTRRLKDIERNAPLKNMG